MDIQVLGAHNCESQNTKCISLLIDDALAIDAGALTSSLSFEAQRKLNAVLLTHQHYDHVKDIPLLAMNFALRDSAINICSTQPVYDALAANLLNGKLYPNFLENPQPNPAIRFTVIEPHRAEQIGGYTILAVPVNHGVPTFGYQVTSPDGKKIFYTADTGAGLADCWKYVSPQLLIIDVTFSDRYRESAVKSGHMTPGLLREELISFREIRGYLPEVVLVHMNPDLEKDIESEIEVVAKSLGSPINLACEGMQLHL